MGAPTLGSILFLRCVLLLGSVRSFSLTSGTRTSTSTSTEFVQHRLVDHVDQLQQLNRQPQRYRQLQHDVQHQEETDVGDEDTQCTGCAALTVVPPPHLFRLPAPGGDICLAVDENGGYHAVRDAFPPFGFPVSESGVVDTQVNAIGDTLFGTRFHLSDGAVRGPWCPGGTAGSFLWIARHLPRRLLKIWTWIRFQRPLSKNGSGVSGGGKNLHPLRPGGTALEVLPLTEHPDGSLTVMLPGLKQQCGENDGYSSRGAKVEGGKGGLLRNPRATKEKQSWVENCGLAGYDH